MIKVNDDYVIQVDNLNYTVFRDTHRMTTRKTESGEKEEVPYLINVGYYSDFAGAIRGVIKDMNKLELSSGVYELKEALEIVVKNNEKFTSLLERVLKVKED